MSARLNYDCMSAGVLDAALTKLGIAPPTQKTIPAKASAIKRHFAALEKAGTELLACTNCKGESTEDLDACPYCGDGEKVVSEPAAAPAPANEQAETPPEPAAPPVVSLPSFVLPMSRFRLFAHGPRNWAIEGVAERGDVVLLVGREGAAQKSMACADLAVAMLTGGTWQGFAVPAAAPNERVLYIVAEGGPVEATRRVRAFARGRGLDPDTIDERVLVTGAITLTGDQPDDDDEPTAFDKLVLVGRGTFACVIVDTLSKCLSGNENETQDANRFMAGAERLAEKLGALVLIVHHPSRAGDGAEARASRGSTAFEASARAVLKCDLGTSPPRLLVTKINNGPLPAPRTYQLHAEDADDPERCSFRFEVGAAAAPAKRTGSVDVDEVAGALRAAPSMVTLSKLRSAVAERRGLAKGSKADANQVNAHVATLVARGVAKRGKLGEVPAVQWTGSTTPNEHSNAAEALAEVVSQ